MAYFNETDRCSKQFGIRLVEISENLARAELTVGTQNMNFMGALHGGALATLADIAAGASTYCTAQRICVTLDSSIQYLRGIRAGKAHALARVIHAGRRTCVCQVEIHDDNATLCCTATVTMYFTDHALLEHIDPVMRAAYHLDSSVE